MKYPQSSKLRAFLAACGVALLAATASAPVQAAGRVVLALDPPTADTNLFWNGTGERLPCFQALVGHDPITGKYNNSELAESWSANEEFTEWTFRLKKNAEFHFGWGPVTAADVVHSYELTTGPDSTINSIEHLRAASAEALDDHTVVFRFETPRTDYAFQHAGRGSMVVYSKAQFDKEGVEGYVNKPRRHRRVPVRFASAGRGRDVRARSRPLAGNGAGFRGA